jgi:endonuclease I/methionine-rich copper-binding protein CopC
LSQFRLNIAVPSQIHHQEKSMLFRKAGAACLLGGVFVFASLSAQAEVFINEIHYDDADTPTAGDQNEALEIVATNGEDLSLYDIVLYNGSTPSSAVTYDTDAIAVGSIVTCGSNVRIGVVNYTSPAQLQNGGNDAIALVRRSSSNVVQFLSYEGVATASNGPAAGQTSISIPVSESNSTAEGTSLQLGGTGATYANFSWNASAANTFGACNNNQTFNLGSPVNVLPSVTSTSPVNNGSVLPGTTNFSVSFSESVTATSNAFILQCSTSGSVPLSFPVTGTNFILTTSTNLLNTETCALTVMANAITDSEAANPSTNTVINFTVSAAPNAAPTVVSTTPSNNAVGVPAASNIRVVFSEKMYADRESFILQCSASGLIPLSFSNKSLEMVAGAGRAMTLSTYTALQAGETCTLTVIAAGIVDDENLTMALNYISRFTVAGGSTSTYYNRVNTSSAEQLRCSLNTVIRGHTVYPYSGGTTSTWDILEIADEDPNSSGKILDVYRNRSYTKVSSRAGTGTGLTYNREHTWPNSLGFGSSTGNLGLPNAPYTDTHMLYLSDTNYNSDRGNDPYGNCTLASGCSERATEINNGNGGGTGVYPGNSNWTNGSRFETWGKRKGDVARAVMYMAIRYEGGADANTGQSEPDLELTDNAGLVVSTSASPAYMGLLADLLQWHQADPPDAAELARNQVIFSYQGNRNPFIDHPEWASAALFTSTKPTSCTLNTPAPIPRRKR